MNWGLKSNLFDKKKLRAGRTKSNVLSNYSLKHSEIRTMGLQQGDRNSLNCFCFDLNLANCFNL